MKYLLDTHALLWIVTDDKQLSSRVKKIFLNEGNDIVVSIASLWEIAIKISLKRLQLGQSLNEFYNQHVSGNKIGLLNIDVGHLAVLETLKFHHRDPFDRLIISQAMVEQMPVLSMDKAFSRYPVKRIW